MLYAAYGSNLHPRRLGARISSARLVGTNFMGGWSLHFHKRGDDGSAKCSILPNGDGVHLAVYEISADDKLALDRIEGVGFGYTEALLTVPEVGDCTTYIAAESHIDVSLDPYDWYKELVLIGARTHGFPDDYLNRISALPACQDPDLIRSARQWKRVEKVKTGNNI
jgi:hypothetical protein